MENKEFTQNAIVSLLREMNENICSVVSTSLHHFSVTVIGFYFIFCLTTVCLQSAERWERRLWRNSGCSKSSLGYRNCGGKQEQTQALRPNGLQVWQRCSLVDPQLSLAPLSPLKADLRAGWCTAPLCLDCSSLPPPSIPEWNQEPGQYPQPSSTGQLLTARIKHCSLVCNLFFHFY